MTFRFICAVLVFLTHAAYAESIRDYVMGREDGSTIHYYILQPSTASASDTLLLILQGSDCNSVLQVEAIFSDYRNVWPEADVLLIEKYGIDKTLNFSADVERSDCPSQHLKNDSPQQRVADIEAVLATVRQRGRYPNLIVLGGSEGAAVANMVAAKVDEVSATVAFNGGGRWFIDDVIHSIAASAEDSADVEEAINSFRGFSRHILNSPPSDLVVSGHGYKWWNEMLSLDQLTLLDEVDTPLLIVQGGGIYRYRLRRWMS
ncbi:alpha/beta hydrolase family protein [Spongiibacter marinus]|uniref:alpha/beta hydrolase family protein n=1 Tax=Spongiibacter marinus TaxID=354246 RepID=UPI000420916D|nr:hypothetical protein [Spongiibacter marinus]